MREGGRWGRRERKAVRPDGSILLLCVWLRHLSPIFTVIGLSQLADAFRFQPAFGRFPPGCHRSSGPESQSVQHFHATIVVAKNITVI